MVHVMSATIQIKRNGKMWQDKANCKSAPQDIFFDENRSTAAKSAEIAKKYCNECIVKQECLDYALDNNVYVGIYGGLSNKQRRLIKHTRRLKI